MATNAASAATPALVGVHLENNGTVIPGTTASSTVTAADDTATLSATTIVDVTNAPATITLVPENGDGSFRSVGMVIRKLD